MRARVRAIRARIERMGVRMRTTCARIQRMCARVRWMDVRIQRMRVRMRWMGARIQRMRTRMRTTRARFNPARLAAVHVADGVLKRWNAGVGGAVPPQPIDNAQVARRTWFLHIPNGYAGTLPLRICRKSYTNENPSHIPRQRHRDPDSN